VPGSALPRRVTLVADELLGLQGGGLGTATTFLAAALARMGHRTEVLYVGDPTARPDEPEWAEFYEQAGVGLRVLPRSDERVEPSYFARIRDVDHALQNDPPDVVVTQDLAAPAYVALRRRQLGLGYSTTSFVVYCHGTRRWIADASRKTRVLPGAHAVTVLERASIELADCAVSPSAYMVSWMRDQGWRLPKKTLVIPLLTRSGATRDAPYEAPSADGRVERLAFFGRLEERKGVTPFVAGLNALDPTLLEDREIAFVGMPWTIAPANIQNTLSSELRESVGALSFKTNLSHDQALAFLSEPRTVAVMPSLEDNSPATVYECLERRIPFIASRAGGTAELIAAGDQQRVLFDPTAAGVADALRRVLESSAPFEPARPSFSSTDAYERWADVIATTQPTQTANGAAADVDVLIVPPDSFEAREEALRGARATWVLFLHEDDVPDDRLVEVLVRAQAASGADVVTCGLELLDGEGVHVRRFFLGDPGALGVLANEYGSVGLIRRSLLDQSAFRAAADPDWLLLAGLSLAGATIVSVPETLVRRHARAADLGPQSQDALIVAQQFERQLPDALRGLPRLAASLAGRQAVVRPNRTIVRRALTRVARSLSRR
jgi:glycosyltransferase involved in cell wall biosynthesis